ncbi:MULTISPECIES: hypothetical protein [unclassified Variovorax]|uniref:hypothetical protein n=1 Tax=unclassified Variovorax TaxID=663243 RepID=UPI001BD64915|nr:MULTISPECIES: hypothetical protein [unclassified Variovorax]
MRKRFPEIDPAPEAIHEFVAIAGELERKLEAANLGVHREGGISAVALLEASAILAQEEFIRTTFGVDAIRPFWTLIAPKETPVYTIVRDLLDAVCGRQFPGDSMSLVVHASLCSDLPPADAFWDILVRLKQAAIDVGHWADVEDVVLTAHRLTSGGTIGESMARAQVESRRFLAFLRKQYPPTTAPLPPAIANCIALFAHYVDLQDAMMAWFSEDPSAYFDLRKYVRALPALPIPPIFVESSRPLPHTGRRHRDYDVELGTRIERRDVATTNLPEHLCDEDGALHLWNRLVVYPATGADRRFPRVDNELWRQHVFSAFLYRYFTREDDDDFLDGEIAALEAELAALGLRTRGRGRSRRGSKTPVAAAVPEHARSAYTDLLRIKSGGILTENGRLKAEIAVQADGSWRVDVPYTIRIPHSPSAVRSATSSSDVAGSIVVPGLVLNEVSGLRIEYQSSLESSMKVGLLIETIAKLDASDSWQHLLLGEAKEMCTSAACKGFRADAISPSGQLERLGGGLVTLRESIERGSHLELVAAWFCNTAVTEYVLKQLLSEATEIGFNGLGFAPSRVVLPEMTPAGWRALVKRLRGVFLL